MNISIVGLGKLGSPMAACFSAKGHHVIGVDVNERFVQAINQGKAPVFEPGLEDMLARGKERLTATTDMGEAILNTDATFLIVPTPSEANGLFSLKYVIAAGQTIGQALKNKDRYHLVVLTSTVMPGATGGTLLPLLEKASGKRCGHDFGLCYSPEFISLGSVIRDMLNPDFILLGESDKRAGDLLINIYRQVTDNHPHVARMGFANAELTKLAVNTFVTTKISYANMLAEICEHLEGGDVDAVTSALGLDTRIGSKYLKGSLGYGGPCFPRDNTALLTLARNLGVVAPLPAATDEINRHQVPRLHHLVTSHLPAGGCVGILGLAYKPQTNVVERAQGTELAQSLLAEGHTVVVHDPCALESTRPLLQGDVQFAASATECARKADVLIVCTPCKEFKTVKPQDLIRPRGRVTLIDCWRLFERAQFGPVCHYVAVGTSDVTAAPATRELRKAG